MGTGDWLRDLTQRHGVELPPELVADLEEMIADVGRPTIDGPSGGSGGSQDTWYAESPTQKLDVPTDGELRLASRYEVLGKLGKGGMGEVHRARDHVLMRVVALKIASRAGNPTHRSRFAHEAQATAQLEHPGIVPIYDYGELEDGALYYTMPVVRGRTLTEVARAVHAASTDGSWGEAADGSSMRRLIGSYLDVCEAMAFAHDRGVIHRDLKPDNVMLGAYGQTLVVDWGLAKVLGGPPEDLPTNQEAVRTARSSSDGTVFGTITGTPHYMSPEQARGDTASMGPASDVWSLGVILYELLAGRPPFRGASKIEVIAAVIARDPEPVERATDLPLPDELVALVESCLVREARDRPQNAGVLADEVRAWLDGERRREQAQALVAQAHALGPVIEANRSEAERKEAEAAALLESLESWDPVANKRPGWALQDEAQALRLDADRGVQTQLQRYREALRLAPDLPAARIGLADYYRRRHEEAEAAGDRLLSDELEALLRAHDTGRHRRYLDGLGTLDISFDPPTTRVEVRPQVVHERRLIDGEPVHEMVGDRLSVDLPAGSYRLALSAPGSASVSYPVHVRRGGRWDVRAPGEQVDRKVWLPRATEVGPREVVVPAGWFHLGGDPEAHAPIPGQRVWVDDFAIDRTPVTVGDWLDFLADLRRTGRHQEYEQLRPPPELMGLTERPDGGLDPAPDAEGFLWKPSYAMALVSYVGARAYAAWRSDRDGLPWRLPTEVEWEKAARGVDGRLFPWGNFLDPTWCAIGKSYPGDPVPRPVLAHPVDCSPYGARDMAGTTCEWTSSLYREEGPRIEEGREVPSDPTPAPDGSQRRVGRGAAFYFAALFARTGTRMSITESRAAVDTGLRLVRSL